MSAVPSGDAGPDWAAFHLAGVSDLVGCARSLSEAELAAPVPATPEWTGHQVLAHLAGVAADLVHGRMDGAPGPQWTARHVAERASSARVDLLAELERHAPAVAELMADSARPAVVWDLAVHHADLHEALDLGRPDPAHWEAVARAVGVWRLTELASAPGVGGVRVRWSDGTVTAYGPQDEVGAELDSWEVFRTVFSRRSRRQVAAWAGAWPAEARDGLCVFGPREDDQPTI